MIFGTATHVLSREIVVEKSGDRVCYRFPRRRLGWLHLIGLVPFAFGVAFVSVPLAMIWHLLGSTFQSANAVKWLLLLFPLLFIFAGLKPISFGLVILFGRSRVELSRDMLRAIDSAGPFRHVRKVKRENIRSFEVKVSDGKPAPSFLQFLSRMGALDAKLDNAKDMSLVLGYPREWLVALGDELTARINEQHVVSAQAPLPPTAEVVKPLSVDKNAPLAIDDVPVQPASSRVRVDETSESITLAVPPAGVWRGTKGMFLFGLIWCGFMVVFTTVMLIGSQKAKHSLVIISIFMSVFWAIGIAMLLGAINMGRRRAVFVATANDLRVAQESIFGRKVWTWSRDELSAVRVDRSGMEVNYKPVLELQIHAGGKKTGFFAGRDHVELQWIATVLRRRLQVPAQ